MLKIGRDYGHLSTRIIRDTENGIKNVSNLLGVPRETAFSGAAGGLRFGISLYFDAEYELGGLYFSKLLNLEEKIDNCDLVVTGEGRLDNTACGKLPASVARVAGKYGKKVIYVCGYMDEKCADNVCTGIVEAENSQVLKEMGIRKALSCNGYYMEHPIEEGKSYEDRIRIYKTVTPLVLKKLFKDIKV